MYSSELRCGEIWVFWHSALSTLKSHKLLCNSINQAGCCVKKRSTILTNKSFSRLPDQKIDIDCLRLSKLFVLEVKTGKLKLLMGHKKSLNKKWKVMSILIFTFSFTFTYSVIRFFIENFISLKIQTIKSASDCCFIKSKTGNFHISGVINCFLFCWPNVYHSQATNGPWTTLWTPLQ